MTSSEADKFMGKHSSMAVRVGADGIWIAWDLFISKYPFDTDLVYGFTREEAVSKYKSIHHPEKPHYTCGDATLLFEDVIKAFRDSAKYRRIVELFQEFKILNQPNHVPTAMGVMQEVGDILGNDLSPTHCDKCGQELPFETQGRP